MQNYYILSKKHSNGEDMLVFWRANSSEYCYRLDWAGKYTQEEVDANKSYYNDKDTMPVPCEEVEEVAVTTVPFDHKVNKWFEE